MKRNGDKVAEIIDTDEDELTEFDIQKSDEDIYLEILGDDGEIGIDTDDELVIVQEDGVLEDENEGGV